MAIREDLVASAVTFLQDPSVANAPVDKRIAFLQSKNLTQEEIDAALARAADIGNLQQSSPPGFGNSQQQLVRQQQQSYSYGQYPGGYWQQQPPPQVPRRDWRDWFIMATLMSGLSYGVYFIAKRYIMPIISPPTPPQLEQDKNSIDEQFNRAFSLIEQLTSDTADIKASEEARKQRLDTVISEFETAINGLRDASHQRDQDTRRIGNEVSNLQTLIPQAMKAQEKNADMRLQELNTELKSLKTLIANRMGSGQPTSSKPNLPSNGVSSLNAQANGNGSPSGTSTPVDTSVTNESNDATNTTKSSFGRFNAGKNGIPSWQLAAAKKNEGDGERKDTSESGTVEDANGRSNNGVVIAS